MRLKDFLVVMVVITILIAGLTGLMGSGLYREKEESDNTVNGENKISTKTPFDTFSMKDSLTRFQRLEQSTLNTYENLPFIPYSDSASLGGTDFLYTFNFSAKEGDKIHMKVSATRNPSLQVVLMPIDELSIYAQQFENRTTDPNPSFKDIEELPDASNEHTRHFEVHVTIPEDDEYSLVISSLSKRIAKFEVIIGKGLFSTIVIRSGGYLEFFLISSFFVIVLGTGLYLYKRRKKKTSLEEETEDWSEEKMKKSERIEGSGTKDPPAQETESSSDGKEFLQYGD